MTGRGTGAEPSRLGPLEAQVMDRLWDGGPATVRNLIDALPGAFAYTTIATVLGNLQRKKLVTTKKAGHSTMYSALVGREEQVAAIMTHALDTSRDRAASILHFVQSMPEGDLALLREYLAAHEGTPGK